MLTIIKKQLPIKVSEQLLICGISTSDKQDLFEMYSNEKVSKYISRKVHSSLQDTEELIEIINQRIKDGDNLYLGVYKAGPRKLIGIIRFIYKENDLDSLTIGYALNENYWGRGIMPEALNRLISIISSDGSYKRLRATVRPENIKSQKCLEKLGFVLAGKFIKKELLNNNEVETERFEYFKTL